MAAKPVDAALENEERMEVNRREFLNFAWLASLGFLTINLGGVTFLFSMPRFKEGEFGGVITVGKVSDLPGSGAPPVNFPKVKLWLSNTGEGIAALYKVCTHLGCLYNWNNQEGKFICPCHGSQFEADGTYIQGPAPRSLDRFVVQPRSLDRFVVQVVDPDSGDILAEAAEGDPLPVPEKPEALVKVDTGKRILGERHP